MPTPSVTEIKVMLRIMATIVSCEGPAYFPLLEKLQRDYETARRDDVAEYAQRLLDELAD